MLEAQQSKVPFSLLVKLVSPWSRDKLKLNIIEENNRFQRAFREILWSKKDGTS